MKKLYSLILAAVMLIASVAVIPAAAGGSDFSDVGADRWSYASVRYAVDNGYMVGTAKDRFSPENPLTRAMVATVLWRRQGSPKPKASSGFEDVADGAWYRDAVAWAKENGVVSGVSKSRFAPDTNVTREQLATMLYRFSSSGPVYVTERADITTFNDFDEVSSWATDALGWAVEAGLIKGVSGNRLSPGGNATREQFAAIIERYDGKFTLEYSDPVLVSRYTAKKYPLVKDADFYVSTKGSDDNDGSFKHPFATWNRAVEAVRALDKTDKNGVTVAFMAGSYGPLSVTLTAEDSGTEECPITYCAYGDGDVIFNDGVEVPASDFSPVSDEVQEALFTNKAKGKIYVADVSGKIDGYDVQSLVLSDSGEMNLARFPDKYDDNTDNLLRAAETTGIRTMKFTFPTVLRRLRTTYHTLDGLKIYGFLTFGWYKEMLSVGDVNLETGDFDVPDYYKARSYDFTGGLRWEVEPDGNIFFKEDVDLALVNLSEDLDAQREFWIDVENEKMYVYGEPENYHIIAGSAVMLTMSGVRCITVRGIDFYNSDRAMIDAYGEGITIEDCVFSGCGQFEDGGEAAVHVSIPEDANDGGVALPTVVRGCEFRNAAGNGLFIEGCRRGANILKRRSNVTVDNCFFTECNIRKSNTGALRLLVSGATVTHNEIVNTCWEGLDYRSCSFVTASYNLFENVCYNGDDTGAVNAYNGEEAEHNVISHNLFLAGTAGSVGRYCAYLDDSCGTEFCHNLIFNCGSAVMSNGNRNNNIHHNVIVNTESSPAAITIHEGCTVLTLEAGASGDFNEVVKHDTYKRWREFLDKINNDPEWHDAAAANMPELLDLTYDTSRWQDPAFIMNTVNEAYSNRMISYTGAGYEYSDEVKLFCNVSDNLAYGLSDNPLFVNPTQGDYRIRDGVDFPDIEFEKIGRY